MEAAKVEAAKVEAAKVEEQGRASFASVRTLHLTETVLPLSSTILPLSYLYPTPAPWSPRATPGQILSLSYLPQAIPGCLSCPTPVPTGARPNPPLTVLVRRAKRRWQP